MGVSHLLPLLGADLLDAEGASVFSNFTLALPVYSGPFEILLSRIDEGQISLADLSLTEITSAFLDFLNQGRAISINAAAEFLYIAAYLLELKARSLLPALKDEGAEVIEEVETDLILRLEQYKTFKEIAEGLRQKREHFSLLHSREHLAGEIERPITLVDVELKDLVAAFSRVWTELGKRGEVKEIAAETITVEDKIKEICDCLGSSPEGIDFEALFTLRTAAEGDLPQAKGLSYLEVVVTFLAILELAKRRLIRIVQGGDFGTIRIFGVIH